MFLIRAAFWLFVVLAFLPVDRSSDEGQLSISPVAAFTAAKSTIEDMAGFCSRNPDACETGRETARAIGERAQTGAKAVYKYFVDQPDDVMARPAQDTLTDADRSPIWVGPSV